MSTPRLGGAYKLPNRIRETAPCKVGKSDRPPRSIYVGNLNYEIEQEDLSEVFSEYGSVKRVHLPIDRETVRQGGFGFVEIETEAAEVKAIETLDGAEWMGREIRVNKARPRDNRSFAGARAL
jgi:RNA recognition motif-containing protein